MKKWILAFMAAMFSFTATAAEPVVTLTPQNSMSLRSEVDDASTSRLILQLMEYKGEKVYLYINSPGGSIIAGNQLIQAIHSSGHKVVCIADFAASMAFSILQSCDTRLVTDDAIVMQHQGSTEVRGNMTKLKKEVEFLQKLTDGLNKDDSSRIGMSLEAFQAKIHDEWWLVGADEIVDSKVADGVTRVKCSAELAKKREVQVIDSMFGQAVLTWSGCPLASYPVAVELKRKTGTDLRDYRQWLESLYLDQNWKMHRNSK